MSGRSSTGPAQSYKGDRRRMPERTTATVSRLRCERTAGYALAVDADRLAREEGHSSVLVSARRACSRNAVGTQSAFPQRPPVGAVTRCPTDRLAVRGVRRALPRQFEPLPGLAGRRVRVRTLLTGTVGQIDRATGRERRLRILSIGCPVRCHLPRLGRFERSSLTKYRPWITVASMRGKHTVNGWERRTGPGTSRRHTESRAGNPSRCMKPSRWNESGSVWRSSGGGIEPPDSPLHRR